MSNLKMRLQMDLFIKCVAAVIIMIVVHYISKTKNKCNASSPFCLRKRP